MRRTSQFSLAIAIIAAFLSFSNSASAAVVLQGQVVEQATGNPVRGYAWADLYRQGEFGKEWLATSQIYGESGQMDFSFEITEPGDYYVLAGGEGYVAEWYDDTKEESEAYPITLTPGQFAENVSSGGFIGVIGLDRLDILVLGASVSPQAIPAEGGTQTFGFFLENNTGKDKTIYVQVCASSYLPNGYSVPVVTMPKMVRIKAGSTAKFSANIKVPDFAPAGFHSYVAYLSYDRRMWQPAAYPAWTNWEKLQ